MYMYDLFQIQSIFTLKPFHIKQPKTIQWRFLYEITFTAIQKLQWHTILKTVLTLPSEMFESYQHWVYHQCTLHK